ncbi:MAG: hypothetical protein DMG76_29480 [Acidobacteria bacterium]|nr:MAG: hypothetical protein DMG76_29480 [Acidobacteriota bacterium]
MAPGIATILCAGGIIGLFVLDRDRNARISKALWIPVLWISLSGSRMVSQWLGLSLRIATADQAVEGSPLDRNILAGLIAVGLLVCLRRRREVGALLRANASIVVFFAYCAASILWSDYPFVAFKRWTKAIGDLVMILIVLSDPDRSAAMKRFVARIGFLLVPASILLIKYYPGLGQVYGLEGKVRYTGVTLDKNTLGAVCLISGVGCVWRLVEALRGQGNARKAGPLIAQITLLAMVLWLFQKADSMTSLACFVLAAALMAVTSFRALAGRRAVVHLLVGGVLCFAFAALFLEVGAGLVETVGRDSTLTGRADLWKHLLSMNEHPIFGSGFETFWLGKRLEDLWQIYWWQPNESHNGYLEVFLNLGWIGEALLAVVIAAGYRNLAGASRHDPDTGGLRLAYFVAGAAYGLTEAAFRVLSPVWIVFLLAISAVPRGPLSKATAALPRPSGEQHRRDFALALAGKARPPTWP